MRLFRSILPPLAAAALCAGVVQPAAAQQVATADYVRPVVRNARAHEDPAQPRTLAVYRFTTWSIPGMPSQVTVADSAGELVATYRRSDSRNALPMLVDVLDRDITLHGATSSGVLTLVLYGENDSEPSSALIGRWTLGDRQGELRGHRER
jgi:hypothetical protein